MSNILFFQLNKRSGVYGVTARYLAEGELEIKLDFAPETANDWRIMATAKMAHTQKRKLAINMIVVSLIMNILL